MRIYGLMQTMGTDRGCKEGCVLYCARWESPEEELVGVAGCIKELVTQGGLAPSEISLAAPNRNWAVQAQRALDKVRVKSCVCMPAKSLSAKDAEALCALDLIAYPDDEKIRSAWIAFGHSESEACAFTRKYKGSCGRSALHASGIEGKPLFEACLLHIEGDEDTQTLSRVIHGQLADPTPPPEKDVCPILKTGSRLLEHGFKWVFAIALVEGLYASEGFADEDTADALDGLERTLDAASETAVASWFKKIDSSIAKQAGLHIARTRKEHGRQFALCTQIGLLSRLKVPRPATISGVEFAREVAGIAADGQGKKDNGNGESR